MYYHGAESHQVEAMKWTTRLLFLAVSLHFLTLPGATAVSSQIETYKLKEGERDGRGGASVIYACNAGNQTGPCVEEPVLCTSQGGKLVGYCFFDGRYEGVCCMGLNPKNATLTTKPPHLHDETTVVPTMTTQTFPPVTMTTQTLPPAPTMSTQTLPPAPTMTSDTLPPAPTMTTQTFPPASTPSTQTMPPAPTMTSDTFPPAPTYTTQTMPPAPTMTSDTLPPAPTMTTQTIPTSSLTTESLPPATMTTQSLPPAPTMSTQTFPPAPSMPTQTPPPAPSMPTQTPPPAPSIPTQTPPPAPSPPSGGVHDDSTTAAPTAPSMPTMSTQTMPPAPTMTTQTIPPAPTMTTQTMPPAPTMTTQTLPPASTMTTQTMPPAPTMTTQTMPPAPTMTTQTMPPAPTMTTQTLPPASTMTTQTMPPAPTMTTQTMPPAPTMTTQTMPPVPSETTPTAPAIPSETTPTAPAMPSETTPTVPAVPSETTPTAPAFPSTPQTPAPPTAPTAPSTPALPSAPTAPSTPATPSAPTAPTTPAAPAPSTPPAHFDNSSSTHYTLFPTMSTQTFPTMTTRNMTHSTMTMTTQSFPEFNFTMSTNQMNFTTESWNFTTQSFNFTTQQMNFTTQAFPNFTMTTEAMNFTTQQFNMTMTTLAMPNITGPTFHTTTTTEATTSEATSDATSAETTEASTEASSQPSFDLPQDGAGCGVTSPDIQSIFQNPSYPSLDTEPNVYEYAVIPQDGFCALRIEFLESHLAGKTSEGCSIDSVVLINSMDTPTVPQCGLLQGYEYTVRQDPGQPVKIVVTTQSSAHLWSINATQIRCSSILPYQDYESPNCGVKNPKQAPPGVSIHQSNKEEPKSINPMKLLKSRRKSLRDIMSDPFIAAPSKLLQNSVANRETSIKIVRGNETAVNEYPWQALLMVNGRPLCGAAIVNDQWVATAGHCVQLNLRYPLTSVLTVDLGDHDLRTTKETKNVVYRVSKVVPNVQNEGVRNDIALIKLATKIPIGKTIRPICLPGPKIPPDSYAGRTAITTGWGRTEDSVISPVLREAALPIISNEKCRQQWSAVGEGAGSIIESGMVCAGGGEIGPCNGDSGGPLVVEEDDKYRLVGLTSFGLLRGCAISGVPSVFTRVTSYLDWIALNLADA